LATKLASKGLLAFSVHPGVVSTNLGGHIGWATDLDCLVSAVYICADIFILY
jgi:hypothetical protein